MNNKAGKYITNLTGDASYKSYKPTDLPVDIKISAKLQNKIIKTYSILSKLDALVFAIPNIDLYVSMYVRKEALLSSIIEGTQCTLDDILNPNAENNSNLDVKDVINYVKAIDYSIEQLGKTPICNRLLKQTHKILLKDVRGKEKNPGEFRKSQNWIGPSNSSIKDAKYIPPNVEDMKAAINALETYINEQNDDIDLLLKIGLIHYQFETIHPFLDGNGRIGRLLITLLLIENKILSKPVIYISYFLKKNQIEYYNQMSEVRRTGNYEMWLEFFVDALYESSKDSLETVEKLIKLHNKNSNKLVETNRKKDNLRQVFEYIEQYPIINITDTAKDLNISYNTVVTCIDKLVELKILKPTNKQLRNKIYAYEEYLDILRKDTNF